MLRDMLGKTSWYSIDVSGNDRHILLFYKKCQLLSLATFCQSRAAQVNDTRVLQCNLHRALHCTPCTQKAVSAKRFIKGNEIILHKVSKITGYERTLKVLDKSVGLCKTTKRKDQLFISLLVFVWRIICENFNPNELILAEIWMKI